MTAGILPQAELPLGLGELADPRSPARVARCETMIAEARAIVRDALDAHCQGRELRGTVILFSGGNDSTVLAHLFRDTATHAAHANTGIGIEQTRQFVRDQCAAWGLPLLEKRTRPGRGFRELVLGQVDDLRNPGRKIMFRGFPGPASHTTMFAFLKERSVDAVKRDLVSAPRSQRVVFLAGRRRAESARRSGLTAVDVQGSAVWVSPLINWTAADLNTYRAVHDVPRNEVSDLLHMSGECLCGAFAHPGELDEIGDWFPDAAQWIRDLERESLALGTIEPQRCRWGWGADREAPSAAGPMCSSCEFRFRPAPPEIAGQEPLFGGALGVAS